MALEPSVPAGRVFRGDPASYRRLLGALQPGDVLELAPGVYRDGLAAHDLHGAPGAPITIAGPDGGDRPIFLARDGLHTVSLMDASHLVLRRLELDGQHRAADGVKAEGQGARRCVAVHDIVLDDLYIHDHDRDQQTVGINAKCNAWRWTVRSTVIERAGTGIYLGGSAGDTPFMRGVIERTLITDTIGYNLQIKHQGAWPDLPGAPGDAGATVIRYNVFSKSRRGSSGDAARPNVLVGHWPPAGRGAGDHYEVYGNFFHNNPTGEPLFQAEGRVAIYNNLFVNRGGDAVWIRPHRDRPRQVHLFWNTVLATGRGIRITGADPAAIQLVVANVVLSGDAPIDGGIHRGNITDRYDLAAEYLMRPFDPPDTIDLSPRPGRLRGAPVDLSGLPGFSHGGQDIEGRPRDGTYRGAYHGPRTLAWSAPPRRPV